MEFDGKVLAAMASGVAVGLLGVAAAIQRPRRSSTLLFAAFALCWGAEIVAANIRRAGGDETWTWLTLALMPAASLFLAGFTASYPLPMERSRARVLVGGFAALALAAVAALAFVPERVFGPGEDGAGFRYGVLAPLLILGPFYGALSVAMLRFLSVWRAGRSGGDEARWLLAGLLLFVAYANTFYLRAATTSAAVSASLSPATRLAFVVVFLGGVLATALAILTICVARPRGRLDPLLLAAALFPLVVAGAEWAIDASGGRKIETLGIWRLATVAVVAYGIVRYHLFDIDLRIKWTLSRGAVAASIAGAFFVGTELLEKFLPVNDTLLGVLAAGAIALAMRPLHRLAVQVVDQLLPSVHAGHAYLHRRKVEVYRLALAQASARGDPRGDPFLEHLRTTLGLSPLDLRAAGRDRSAGGPGKSGKRPNPS